MGLKSPFVRLGIAAAVVLMIFSIPAREAGRILKELAE